MMRAVPECAVLYPSDAVSAWKVLRPDQDDETSAVSFLRKYADQRIGFTDCISFALMRARRIRRAFTFDRHF